jgi:hypothetical protein
MVGSCFFNPVHQSVFFDLGIEAIGIQSYYWKVCVISVILLFCGAWFHPILYLLVVIWWYLFFPVFSWLHLSSFSMCRIPLSVFCSAGLVVINCITFCLSWKVLFLFQLLMKYLLCNLGWQLVYFRAWNESFHTFFAFNVSVEKSAWFWCVCLYR